MCSKICLHTISDIGSTMCARTGGWGKRNRPKAAHSRKRIRKNTAGEEKAGRQFRKLKGRGEIPPRPPSAPPRKLVFTGGVFKNGSHLVR